MIARETRRKLEKDEFELKRMNGRRIMETSLEFINPWESSGWGLSERERKLTREQFRMTLWIYGFAMFQCRFGCLRKRAEARLLDETERFHAESDQAKVWCLIWIHEVCENPCKLMFKAFLEVELKVQWFERIFLICQLIVELTEELDWTMNIELVDDSTGSDVELTQLVPFC